MANLKKLFQPTSPRSVVDLHGVSSQQYASQFPNISNGEPASPASLYDIPSTKDVNRHYEGIEKQFEQLHETFYSRTLASLRQFRYAGSSDQAKQRNRHVDVVEAVFSRHRYQMTTRSMSPITPYNEDIADRNIIAQYLPRVDPRFSHLISSSYQEDVADRNISRSKSNPIYRGPRSSGLSVRSHHREERRSLRPKPHRDPRTSYPPADVPKAHHENRASSPSLTVDNNRLSLRPQASAPDLGLSEIKTPDLASFPRPPTSSGVLGGSGEAETTKDNSPASSEKVKAEASSSSRSTSTNSRASGKKNVRDLSINTSITSMKKPSIRIEHCAIQPPAPSNNQAVSKNASIDEIVHTPLLTVTPNHFTPQPSPGLDVDEIMRILKQAYISNHKYSPQYPTFESLQEVIIREINSHDAFRSVPFPTDELPFTPPASDNSLDDNILLPPPGPSRVKPLPPEKESPLSRLMRRRSNMGPGNKSPPLNNSSNSSPTYHDHQNTETDKYQTATKRPFPREVQPTVIPRRRRHTYGEPPTPSTSFTTTQPHAHSQYQPEYYTQQPSISHSHSTSCSNFSLFPSAKTPPQPRYKSHFKRKSDPVPPSPHINDFVSNDAATPPIYPSYVRR
ncbi:hypothetical protein UA08_00254 [Talaromyces atroroseus]|uniref:Uncharacterized protein n=1 Tax=Talaromyces atroroseus TaxID=1441469 RepID=A0A225BBF3_TALAT|nr:hypothetical protein UA08_00254 [Talaromyces atroroseus]OKL64235.1 hypothetical protein UA08_00254 [Talaromyces atroroseus]